MSFPAKRQHEEVAAEVVGVAEGSVMEVEVPGGEEARPAKVARLNNDREVEESEESVAYGNGGGAVEVREGERSKGEEVLQQEQQQGNVVVVEFGAGLESDREGRDPGRMELESGGNENGGEGSCVVEEEVLGRVNVKGDEQQQQQQQRASNCAVAQEFVDSNCREANSEGLREASPPGGEGKVVVKDVALDVKKDAEPHENEIEKKDEKQSERKEEALPLVLEQQQPQMDVNSETENERDTEKVEKEKERARERERGRSRENEKEAAALTEKREKREKERDRDPHRREREEREKSLTDKVVKEVGKPVKLEVLDMDRKPVDERKLVEKEGRERVRERERNKDREDDGEGEKRKKRVREQEKDRDSFDAESVGGETDKDTVHGNGVQQRKRLLRSRGQPNPSNRDSRSRFRPKDNEVTQGKPESSFIKYKAGDGMPELARLWKEHESAVKNSSANGSGPTIEIRISAEFATTANRQIRGSQLWGTDIYTDDSDIVAVLFHTGYYTPSATPPPNSISELRATIRILESLKMYTSTLRNSLRSRAWGGASGCSYRVERCRIMKQGGGSVELEPCLARTPQVAPTLAPAASERTVTTRAASSSAYRQQRLMQEVTIQYNLCNEPWAKYSMSIVADRGLKKSQFTSARLKNGEVLYVETHVHRYELAYDGERTTCNGATTATTSFPQGVEKVKEKSGSAERASEASEKEAILHTNNGDKPHGNHHPHNGQVGGHHAHIVIHHPHEYYRWSKCKRPLPLSSMKRKGLPLPEEFVEVLEEGLTWEEVQWSPTSVWVRGVEYILNRAQFFSPDEE